MAVLDIYTHPSWLDEFEDEDLWWEQQEVCPPEALSIDSGRVWWTAALDTTDDE